MMKKNISKIAVKVVIPACLLFTMVGSYVMAQGDLFPKTNTQVVQMKDGAVENTIDISQISKMKNLSGVSRLFYYDGEDSIAVGMNKDRDDLKSEEYDTDYYMSYYGGIYNYNTTNQKASKVDDKISALLADFGAGYSPNGKFIEVTDGQSSYIFETDTNKSTKYDERDKLDLGIAKWSENGKCLVKYYAGVVENEYYRDFVVYDTNGKKINSKSIIDKNINFVDASTGLYSEDGSVIYFAGRTSDDDGILQTGLYSIDMKSGNINTIISMPHNERKKIKNPGTDLKEHPGEFIEIMLQNRVMKFEILANNNIVFDGLINNVDGLYYYDINTKEIKLLLEYDGGFGFEIAPDESKIVYTIDTPQFDTSNNVKEQKNNTETIYYENNITNKTNVYVANFDESGLSNISYVRKDTFATDFKWSNDSKNLIYYLPESGLVEKVTLK